MPRGAKPKIYPPEFVERIRMLYEEQGMSQTEVAAACGCSLRKIQRVMGRHGITPRRQVKREQRGERNSSWRGDKATYAAFHYRVYAVRGQPSVCEVCGSTTAKRYEWANLTGNYADPNDYKRMCTPCHHKHDGHVQNLGAYAVRKEVPTS